MGKSGTFRWLVLALVVATVLSFKVITSHQSGHAIARNDFRASVGPLHAKKLSPEAQKYLKMREVKKLREQGGEYDDIKEYVVNGTTRSLANPELAARIGQEKKKGYQKYMGNKGSLEGRLRKVIAYKRENIAAEEGSILGGGSMSVSEEQELFNEMESDENDYEYKEGELDDEEAEYEALIVKAIEMNKLKELQRNFVLDKAASREFAEEKLAEERENAAEEAKVVDKTGQEVTEDELYQPSRSGSWGVFKRPKDISKTFGGGRQITREEMQKMDEEWEARKSKQEQETKVFLTDTMKVEKENLDRINKALGQCRTYMYRGDRYKAVESLETVKDVVSYQTDLGGEVLLELAMAYETVDRADDARQVCICKSIRICMY